MCSSKKYNKGCCAIDVLQRVLMIGMIGFGGTSLGSMATVVGTPIAIAMDVGAVVAGILSLTSNRFGKYFSTKLEKNRKKIKILAESKLNTISGYISKALEDGVISNEDYLMILSEYEKFNAMKEEIRMKGRKANNRKHGECLVLQNRHHHSIVICFESTVMMGIRR